MILIIITFISIIYVLLIASLIYGFDKIEEFKLTNITSKTKFSVIVPFRNEAKNLSKLLESINQLQYPKNLFEIILINDDSVAIIKGHFTQTNISLINNTRITNAPKKDAITLGIKHAKHDWIVTTDADCMLPKYWLDSFDEFIQKTKTTCIAAPVGYHLETKFLNKF